MVGTGGGSTTPEAAPPGAKAAREEGHTTAPGVAHAHTAVPRRAAALPRGSRCGTPTVAPPSTDRSPVAMAALTCSLPCRLGVASRSGAAQSSPAVAAYASSPVPARLRRAVQVTTLPARRSAAPGCVRCSHAAAGVAASGAPLVVVHADKDAAAPAPRPALRLARACLFAAVLLVAASSLAGPATAGASSKAAAASLTAEPSLFAQALSFVLHLDKHLTALVAASTGRTYAILFAIVFAETGLVVTPFLPGDSLLFAAGTLAALGSLSLPLLMVLLFVAAVAGDTVNYAAGAWLGAQAFSAYPAVFRPEYLSKTRAFFAKHGPKTIVLARFVPIVRTFAPFVAGVGTMSYPTFVAYNVAGAAVWVVTFCLAGFALGNIPAVRHNFALVTVGIVLVSLLPVLHELLEARRHDAGGAAQ